MSKPKVLGKSSRRTGVVIDFARSWKMDFSWSKNYSKQIVHLTWFSIVLLTSNPGYSDVTGTLVDDFTNDPQSRWEYISDQVMGGKSSGTVNFDVVDGLSLLRLRGKVSTVNNGGFIQARRKIEPLDPGVTGFNVRTRGNRERYFLHIRTKSTRWPWQYYQCAFEANEGWDVIEMRMDECKGSGGRVAKVLKPEKIRSIAFVAYGKEHAADLSIDWISTFK
jgi:hypothetical protein